MDDPNQLGAAVPDFIFGTLATDELRLAQLRAEHAGLWHDQWLDPPDPRPGEPIAVDASAGPGVAADRMALYYTLDGSQPDGARGVARHGLAVQLEQAGVEWDTLLWGYRQRWRGSIPAQPEGAYVRYLIEAWHSAGAGSLYAGGDPPRIYGFHVDRLAIPAWLDDAVIYHLLIDRFAPDPGRDFASPDDPLGGFYGGTLRGVTSRLDYLSQLGVSCLWLSPIFPSPTHHGYDATDYGSVEPRLGDEAALHELLEQAHQRGMRVILDYVANHLSSSHPAFLAAQGDQASEHASWFSFERWPEHYRSFFGVREMPQINVDSTGARTYLIEHALGWLRRGCDGFRLDYANGPSHAFWSEFRAALRQASPESVTIGEVVETPLLMRSYAGRMDGCLDFLLLQALRGFFCFGALAPSQFDSFLRRHFAFFDGAIALPSFLDNHDMNRFLWTVGGDRRRLRLAALCQFTLPGPPVIYYGTEVGQDQPRDVRYADGSGHPEQARFPMLWGQAQDREMLSFYRALVALRRQGGAAWRQPAQTLLVDDQRGLYGYRRGAYSVLLNNSPQLANLGLPALAGAALALASDPACRWDGAAVQLPAYAGVCLRS